MSKFEFPDLDKVDITLIKEYCRIMGYKSIIDRKKGYAKITNGIQSMYIVKAQQGDKVVLGFAKTKSTSNGVVFIRFQSLYFLLEQAKSFQHHFVPQENDNANFLNTLFRTGFGPQYFQQQEFYSLQKGEYND